MTATLAPHHIDVGDARDRLVHHRLYGLVHSPERMRAFMEAHVFAVWDFQCLLKALQQKFTCTDFPWLPTPDREARRLVNELVLDEESDELPEGGHASHFELYVESMQDAGADTRPIERLLDALAAGATVPAALAAARVPGPAADFVRTTFSVIESGSMPAIAAAFTFGREDVIPDMFRHLVSSLAEQDPAAWGRFRFYLERHIAHDDAKHAPICRRIVARLCGDDPAKWAEASRTARECLEARIALWEGIAAGMQAG
ncbi:MAG: DUF3050 domain-containing protein [Planctomycetia bacterium]|nr:DUF3050 domain-containing protein [Planctomycetia bacterium]